MIEEKDKEFLRVQLKGLSDGTIRPNMTSCGICNHLSNLYCMDKIAFESRIGVIDLMKDWPEGTGLKLYPVPAYPLIKCKWGARKSFTNTRNLWTGLYGKRRKALCLWLSEHEDLKDE